VEVDDQTTSTESGQEKYLKQGNILSYFRATIQLKKRANSLLLPIRSEAFKFL
jgi:hypothetical protein